VSEKIGQNLKSKNEMDKERPNSILARRHTGTVKLAGIEAWGVFDNFTYGKVEEQCTE